MSKSSIELPFPQFTSLRLAPAASEEELLLHESALEWSLADPIIIESAADVKSSVSWQDRVAPYHHQMQNLMTFCRRLPVTLIADDVGLGKTISAGLILSELMTRRRVGRALVICPSILGPQWVEELGAKFGIVGRFATGTQLGAELRSDIPLVVSTYESASRRLESLEPGAFDMLILDEAHKLRNLYGTQSPPKLAQRVHKALQQRLFKYVLMLTATPIQNRLWDLYTLVDCLSVAKGHQNPLGTAAEFQRQFIRDGATARILKPEKIEEFRTVLRQYLVRTRREQVRLAFPKREVRLLQVESTDEEVELQQLVGEHIEDLNGFQQSSLLQAMMSSPAALLSQLGNMADKAGLKGLEGKVRALTSNGFRPAKLQGLLQLAEQLREQRPNGWRMVVFTIRKETQRIIGDALTQAGISVGYIRGGEQQANRTAVAAYTTEQPSANVIVSTDAGAEGVNLQAGNVVVNYDLPWNPMIVEQRIGRVQRLASKFGFVTVFNLAVANSPEAFVVTRLMQKLQTISDTVGDIEAVLEASSGEDDEKASFESRIRELVVKSLVGQDVKRATTMAEESIQKARELFDEQRKEIDSTLGDLNELHETGPTMPRLTPVSPKVPYRDFVLRALVAEGAEIDRKDGDQYTVRRQRQPDEEITFDELTWQRFRNTGYFMGRPLKLYLPGKPAFERLVERWLNRSAHRILDLTGQTQAIAKCALTDWLANIDGATLVRVETRTLNKFFQGTSVSRVTASNALDSYEKLITVAHTPESHTAIKLSETFERWNAHEVEPEKLVPGVLVTTAGFVEADSDVGAFTQFYMTRLEEEIGKAGSSNERRAKVIDDLKPNIHGQILSMQGASYQSCRAALEFAIDGNGGYAIELELIPATGTILTEIAWEKCEESSRRVPAGCLETCEISKVRVLRHLLTTSDLSGRRILTKLSERCELSGKTAAGDEFLASDVSGQRAISTMFKASPISGRQGLPHEFAECDFSKTRVLRDEIRNSQVSDRPYRIDQEVCSAMSGRIGHHSEFVRCSVTDGLILPTEGLRSDLDASIVRLDQVIRSERPPYRKGRPDQRARCEFSDKLLLLDEVAKCEVTGQTIDQDLLEASHDTGRLALPHLLVTCACTGKRLLPDESITSAVSGKTIAKSVAELSPVTGRFAAPDEFTQCQLTGAQVLWDELVESEVSHLRFRSDEAVLSEFSHRCGHASESVKCGFTGKALLKDEVAESSVSSKITAASVLVVSDKSGRKCHPLETVKCEFTGVILCSDETSKSTVSGKIVDSSLLVPSAASGNLALDVEMVRCDVSQLLLLPSETVICCVTNQRIDKRRSHCSDVSGAVALATELVECVISHKKGLRSELVWCEATNEPVLPSFIEQSTVSGRKMRRDKMIESAASGRYAAPNECRTCEITGAQVMPDEIVQSDLSQRWFRKDQSVFSHFSGRLGHASEVVTCAFSGSNLLQDEAAQSCVSSKLTAATELVESDRSQRKCHPTELVVCDASGIRLCSDEAATSAVSGKRVDASLLVPSMVSGKLATKNELVQCELSQIHLLPSEAVNCSVTGKLVDERLTQRSDVSGSVAITDEVFHCAISKKKGLRSELVWCQLTNEPVLPSYAEASAVSGRTMRRDRMAKSALSDRYAAPDECRTCEFTGVQVLPDEIIQSDVSKRWFRKDQVAKSAFSDRIGHRSELLTCEFTGGSLLWDEAATSNVSGKRTAATQLVASQKSGRKCDRSEIVRCEASGIFLCSDEVGKSCVSGRIVDRSLLVASASSGKVALQSEMIRCQASGADLLPAETAVCCASSKRVDVRLLRRSEVSGSAALPAEMVRCSISGKQGLPQEFVWCQLTREPVLPQYTETCAASGLQSRRDRMVQSKVSGRWMQPKYAVKSFVDGSICCPAEAVLCHWHQKRLLASQADTCRRTGLTFLKSLLNESQQLRVLDQVLKNEGPLVSFENVVPVLRKLDKRLTATSRAWGAVSPDSGTLAICAEISEYLGLRVHYLALVVRMSPQPQILGEVTKLAAK